jgi:hypothetical protein
MPESTSPEFKDFEFGCFVVMCGAMVLGMALMVAFAVTLYLWENLTMRGILLVLAGLAAGACVGYRIHKELEQPRRRRKTLPKPPERVLSREQVKLTTVAPVPVAPLSQDPECYTLRLQPCREVFGPVLGPDGKRFKVIFTGACNVLKRHTSSPWYGIDACYSTDEYGNFTVRHHSLTVDGEAATCDPIEADRAAHRYVYIIRADDTRLSILINSPIGPLDVQDTKGSIEVSITPLTQLEETLLGYPTADEEREADERRAAEQQAEEERWRKAEKHAKEQKHQQALASKALVLAAQAHLETYFLDPDFRQEYADRYRHDVRKSLAAEWLSEYRSILADRELHTLITAQYPGVIPFLEARLEVARLAQRLLVKPPPEPSAPKPKTPDEHRDAELSWEKIKTQDYTQKRLLQMTEEQAYLAELTRQFPNLNEDELARELQKFRDAVYDAPSTSAPLARPPMKTY